MLALTGVKLFSPKSTPCLQMTYSYLPAVSLSAEKTFRAMLLPWCFWLIMVLQLKEQGQVNYSRQ